MEFSQEELSGIALEAEMHLPAYTFRADERPMEGTEAYLNFNAPAVLRKWPSLGNERRTEGTGPYLLVDGTLDECLRVFMAKPKATRHLYEILTAPQQPLVRPSCLESTSSSSPDCAIFSDRMPSAALSRSG